MVAHSYYLNPKQNCYHHEVICNVKTQVDIINLHSLTKYNKMLCVQFRQKDHENDKNDEGYDV